MPIRFHTTGAIAALAIACAQLGAQDAPMAAPRFDLATYAGASIPTGTLRDAFDTGFLLGAQGAYALGTHVGLVGAFDWTHPTTRLVATAAGTNVYQATLGLELGGARGGGERRGVRPFLDIGGGLRRYDYSSSVLDTHTGGAGYASVGTELAIGRSALRLAATDNVFSFEAPTPDATRATRNDIGLTVGLSFHP